MNAIFHRPMLSAAGAPRKNPLEAQCYIGMITMLAESWRSAEARAGRADL